MRSGSPLDLNSAMESLRRRLSAPVVAVVAIAIVVALVDVWWLDRFRFGFVTEWDESGYLAIALDNVHALRAGGPVELVDVVLGQGVQAPLVPLSAVPLNLVFGDGVDSSLVVEPLFHGLLVLATYGLARRLVDPWWAVLAAAVVGSMPLLIDFARLSISPFPPRRCSRRRCGRCCGRTG